MSIQTTTYKRRLREHSGLSMQALLVALTIADLRYEAKRNTHEPLPLTIQQIADACHGSRSGIVRYLNECLESGWIVGRRVFRDSRPEAQRVLPRDPDRSDTEFNACTQ